MAADAINRRQSKLVAVYELHALRRKFQVATMTPSCEYCAHSALWYDDEVTDEDIMKHVEGYQEGEQEDEQE